MEEAQTLSLYKAIEVFNEHLPDIRKACLDNAVYFMESHKPYAPLDIDTEITTTAIHQHVQHLKVQEHTGKLFNIIKRIDSYRTAKERPYTTNIVTDDDIERAREAPEDWFVYQASLSTKRPHKGVCPFHADKDPSLMLMRSRRTNHLYLKCFVCNEAWDSIGYIQKRDNVDFIEAVKIVNS